MRIGRFLRGQCQVAGCTRSATLRIFVRRYKSADAPGAFRFHFDLCPDHRFTWNEEEDGEIERVETR